MFSAVQGCSASRKLYFLQMQSAGRRMRRNKQTNLKMLWTSVLMLVAATVGAAQRAEDSSVVSKPPAATVRSVEDMNYLGGDASMPPLPDSLIPADSAYHN